jgi:hypothetical protein
VWLVDGQGDDVFPVGLLPDSHGIWSLPTEVAAHHRTLDVTLELADGNPVRSSRSVLRGTYA